MATTGLGQSNRFRDLIKSWKQQEQFAGLPHRWYLSAELLVTDCYKALFAQQRNQLLSTQSKQRWLNALQLNIQITRDHEFAEEQIFTTAQIVLQQTRQALLEKSEQQSQNEYSLFETLLDHCENTSEALIQSAIVYLIACGYKIGKLMPDLQKLQELAAAKKKEIERLEQQLKAKFPKGRDPLGQRFEAGVDAAIAGPVLSGDPQEHQAEIERWLMRRQIDPTVSSKEL